MAVATTEVTFLTGMDNLSVTLCQRIDDAVNNIQKEIAQNKILEEEYTVIQQKCILKDKDDPPESKKSIKFSFLNFFITYINTN